MATYYVAKTGNDASSGSQAYPWLTIGKATGVVNAGDTVIIKEGVYNEAVRISRSGTATSWINFRGATGEHVVVDGTGLAPAYPAIALLMVHNSSYIALENMESVNSWEAGAGCRGNCHFLVFRNLYLHECGISSILLFSDWNTQNIDLCTDMLIDSIISEKTNKNPNQEGMSLIGVNRFEVRYSRFLTQYGQAGLDCKEGTRYGKIHHNEFQQEESNGVYLDGGYGIFPVHDIEIYSNKFHDVATAIAMNSENGSGTLEQHKLYNIDYHDNISYNCHSHLYNAGDFMFWYESVAKKENIKVRNNIFVGYTWQAKGVQISVPPEGFVNCLISNNTFINYSNYGNFITFYNTVYGGGNDGGLAIDSNRFYVNPSYEPENVYGTNALLGLNAVLDNAKGILQAGITKTAKVPVTVTPAGTPCSIELWVGSDPTDKVATSGKVPFTATGTAQTINIPIVMLTGVYNVYIDLYAGDQLLASFIGDQMVVVV